MEKSCCALPDTKPKADIQAAIETYRPLIVVTVLSLLAAGMLVYQTDKNFMTLAMGMFFLFIAALKLFNLQGFADSFAKYDVVAARSRVYALAYPFIEVLLGALYLAALWPFYTNVLTIVVMLVGSIGVIKVMRSGSKMTCACVGAGFNLPVGRVTLFEYLIMAAMAAMGLMGLM